MHSVFDALTMLRPYDIDIGKIRIGPKGDGGYVMAADLMRSQTLVSYGISEQYEFDQIMARHGHRVLMFDHTIDPPVISEENASFYKEGCGPVSNGSDIYSIADHLQKYGVEGRNLLLKMDVEGAEYDTILAMEDEELGRFEQIVIEVHNLDNLGVEGFRQTFCRFMVKLNRIFTIFHVHANNYDGPDKVAMVAGLPVVNLLEISFIRTDRVRRRPSNTVYPTHLDYPNGEARDKLLWFYPYFPTSVDAGTFGAVWAKTTGGLI